MKRAVLNLVALGLLMGSALATDVRVQVSDPSLRATVEDALKALSTGGASYTLVNAAGTVFTLGGANNFSPDVASRSFAGTPPRVEFNPKGPISLADAVRAELRRVLGLPAEAVTGTSTAGTSTSGTSGADTSTDGTSTATQPPVQAGPADLNSDGSVDPGDLAIFMANLGKRGANLPGDFNKDGQVNQADFQAFSKLYKLP